MTQSTSHSNKCDPNYDTIKLYLIFDIYLVKWTYATATIASISTYNHVLASGRMMSNPILPSFSVPI